MFLNFLITDQENALTIKHPKSYLMSIYMNVALDLTNYRDKIYKKIIEKAERYEKNIYFN